MAAVSEPVLCEPLEGLAPLQPPDAVQDVVFAELHVRFAAAPLLTLLCEALIDAVGGGAGADESPPPQDVSIRSPAAAAKRRNENCIQNSVTCKCVSLYQSQVAVRREVFGTHELQGQGRMRNPGDDR